MIEFGILLNLILIFGIILGQIMTKMKASPKKISLVISFLCAVLSLYVLLMVVGGLMALFQEKFIIAVALFIFAASPFVIGTAASYKKATFFIALQQCVFILSLVALFKLLF